MSLYTFKVINLFEIDITLSVMLMKQLINVMDTIDVHGRKTVSVSNKFDNKKHYCHYYY